MTRCHDRPGRTLNVERVYGDKGDTPMRGCVPVKLRHRIRFNHRSPRRHRHHRRAGDRHHRRGDGLDRQRDVGRLRAEGDGIAGYGGLFIR